MYAGELDSRAAGSYSEIRLGGGIIPPLFSSFKIVFWKFFLGGEQLPSHWIRPWLAAVHIFFGNPFYILYDICILLLPLKFTPLTPPSTFFSIHFFPGYCLEWLSIFHKLLLKVFEVEWFIRPLWLLLKRTGSQLSRTDYKAN